VLLVPDTLTFRIPATQAPSDEQTVQILNDTRTDVTVFNLTEIVGDPAFRIDETGLGRFFRLGPGDAIELPFRFDPPHGGAFRARVPIGVSPVDDPGDITLVGEAEGPTPVLRTEAAPDTRQYCASELPLTINNNGPDDLIVRGITWEGEDCPAFQVQDLTGQSVAPGARLDVAVTFRPVKPGPHACTLVLGTDVAVPPSVILRGTGLATEVAEERFHVSDGSGLNVLFLHDDAAPDVTGHRARLTAGLPRFIAGLDDEGIDWRLAAASTYDACTLGPFTHATPENTREDAVALVLDNLLDARGTTWADRPLALMAEVSARSGGRCFLGWYEDWEPVHVIVVSARDDASGLTPSAWLNTTRTEFSSGVHVSTITPISGCAASATRLLSTSDQSGGARLDLCAPSWDTHVAELVARSSALRKPKDTFRLAAPPLPGSVQVAINGIATESWEIQGERDVRLIDTFDDGALVLVRYADAGTCR
jgi:hypothetical protein